MTTESAPILQLNNVEAAYGAVKAIRGVSLSVAPGSVVTVLGSNGAGKTTILKTISGILDPQKGSILFRHEKLEGRDPAWIVRQGTGAGARRTRNLPAADGAREPADGRLHTPAREKDEVAKDIEDVYAYFPILKERRDQPAGQLSGGQQQMLAISRALLAKPTMMLLDEPSLGLSPKLTKEIFEIIIRINRERGVTLLVVEQNAHIALKYADYGYVLEIGRIVMHDTCAALREKEDIKEFYLGAKEAGVREGRRWKKKKTWR
jgi:branched-chain amino acid transport system ATP-binding protein